MPRRQIDTDTLITLKQSGKSYREIAQITGANKDVINRRIKDLLPDDDTKVYVETRADILAKLQVDILKSIDDTDIKKSPFGSRVLAMCQLHDKERLERGLSTSNTAVIHADIEQLRQDRQSQDTSTIDIDSE